MIRDLFDGLNPSGFERGWFLIFRGYIDESCDAKQDVFSFACVLTRGKDWDEIERKWKLHLAARNRILASEGRPPISRYHASDCSARKKEFQGWTHDERDSFVRGLFLVLKQVTTFTVVYDTQLSELCEVFPEYRADRLEAAYYWFTRFLMLTISSDFRRFNKRGGPISISLIHDRTGGNGSYDPTILRAFNTMVNDETFKGREMFTTVAPMPWEKCVALQPADLVAFETFKQAQARLEARQSRKSFDALLNLGSFGIHSKTLNKEALTRFKELLDGARARQEPK